jgi:hypothetical protein
MGLKCYICEIAISNEDMSCIRIGDVNVYFCKRCYQATKRLFMHVDKAMNEKPACGLRYKHEKSR